METEEYEHDIIVLVLRLMVEPVESFSVETQEVMLRWMPKAKEVLAGRREI